MKRWLILVLGLSALTLAVLISATPSVRAAQGASDVVVTNTPLPVSGTVQVARQHYRMTASSSDSYGDVFMTNNTGHVFVIEDIALLNQFNLPCGTDSIDIGDSITFLTMEGTGPQWAHALTHLYLDPGEQLVSVCADHVTLSGYLEP